VLPLGSKGIPGPRFKRTEGCRWLGTSDTGSAVEVDDPYEQFTARRRPATRLIPPRSKARMPRRTVFSVAEPVWGRVAGG
jgi:hypothetical protein